MKGSDHITNGDEYKHGIVKRKWKRSCTKSFFVFLSAL